MLVCLSILRRICPKTNGLTLNAVIPVKLLRTLSTTQSKVGSCLPRSNYIIIYVYVFLFFFFFNMFRKIQTIELTTVYESKKKNETKISGMAQLSNTIKNYLKIYESVLVLKSQNSVIYHVIYRKRFCLPVMEKSKQVGEP